MKIGLITSRTAATIIEGILSKYRPPEGVTIDILPLPVPAVGVISVKSIARLFLKHYGRDAVSYDLIVLPGLSPGSPEDFEAIVGVQAVRGPKDPGFLPHAIDLIASGKLGGSGARSYEETGVDPVVFDYHNEIAFYLDGLVVPVRGPPLLLFTEIAGSVPEYELVARVESVVNDGANAVVVGAMRDMSVDLLERRIRIISDNSSVPVICESVTPQNVRRLRHAGCQGFTMSAVSFSKLLATGSSWLKEYVWIVGDREVSMLARVSMLSRSRGIEKLVLDPIVGLPLIDFAKTSDRYGEARELGRPLLFSAANALGELSADSHGTHLLLVSMALELGSSIYLVVEDGHSTVHSTSEAMNAIRLASSAYRSGRTPRDPRSKLYVIRQEHAPPKPPYLDNVIRVKGRIDPVIDNSFFIIWVDHDNREIIVEHRSSNNVKRWASKDPKSLMRVILREVTVSGEHAGYLGFELYNAWLALRTGRTYLQDNPVIVLPWEAES